MDADRNDLTPVCSMMRQFDGVHAAREWLVSDGLGGYAMGTHEGWNSRRYHGLLVAPLPPPLGRCMIVPRLEDTLVFEGGESSLSPAWYEPGPILSEALSPESFAAFVHPSWIYSVAGRRVRRTVVRHRDRAQVTVLWELLSGDPLELLVRPMLTFRSHHHLARESTFDPHVEIRGAALSWRKDKEAPRVAASWNGELIDRTPFFYRNIHLQEERTRGFDFVEDHHAPILIGWNLGAEPAWMTLGLEPLEAPASAEAAAGEPAREIGHALVRASDAFILRHPRGEPGILAGFPWFTEWGRDTMLALPGILLESGRFGEAQGVLHAWAKRVRRGLLPNRLDDFEAGENATNTADAPLLFVRAVKSTSEASGVSVEEDPVVLDAVFEILEWYHAGTDHGIRVDADGLLGAGEERKALTWMDAIVGGLPVTPRIGKPIELNALYLDALRSGARWAALLGDSTRRSRFESWLRLLERSFAARFLAPGSEFLCDVIDGPLDASDDSLRPNLLFALALEPLPLPRSAALKNLARVEKSLLTPVGLRTLDPSHADYRGRYEGTPAERDGAYHQGTVWPWLLGPYADAVLRLRGTSRTSLQVLRRNIDPLTAWVADRGSIPEVFDGDPPHRPGGCPAQAWSVAEVRRILHRIESHAAARPE